LHDRKRSARLRLAREIVSHERRTTSLKTIPIPTPRRLSLMSGRPIPPRLPGESASAEPSPAERVATLEAEKAELKDRMLRIAAEFDNYKSACARR